jgi:hypothetical protein
MRRFNSAGLMSVIALCNPAVVDETAGDTEVGTEATQDNRLSYLLADGTEARVDPASGTELNALLRRLGIAKKELPSQSEMGNAFAEAVRTGDLVKIQALATNLVEAGKQAASLNVLMKFPGATNCRVGDLDVNARAGVNAIVGEDKAVNQTIRKHFVPKTRK